MLRKSWTLLSPQFVLFLFSSMAALHTLFLASCQHNVHMAESLLYYVRCWPRKNFNLTLWTEQVSMEDNGGECSVHKRVFEFEWCEKSAYSERTVNLKLQYHKFMCRSNPAPHSSYPGLQQPGIGSSILLWCLLYVDESNRSFAMLCENDDR